MGPSNRSVGQTCTMDAYTHTHEHVCNHAHAHAHAHTHTHAHTHAQETTLWVPNPMDPDDPLMVVDYLQPSSALVSLFEQHNWEFERLPILVMDFGPAVGSFSIIDARNFEPVYESATNMTMFMCTVLSRNPCRGLMMDMGRMFTLYKGRYLGQDMCIMPAEPDESWTAKGFKPRGVVLTRTFQDNISDGIGIWLNLFHRRCVRNLTCVIKGVQYNPDEFEKYDPESARLCDCEWCRTLVHEPPPRLSFLTLPFLAADTLVLVRNCACVDTSGEADVCRNFLRALWSDTGDDSTRGFLCFPRRGVLFRGQYAHVSVASSCLLFSDREWAMVVPENTHPQVVQPWDPQIGWSILDTTSDVNMVMLDVVTRDETYACRESGTLSPVLFTQ